METLAKRLKYARTKRKMTQSDLAKASGVGQSDISKIERGEIQKTTALLALARALQVNANWLDVGNGMWDDENEEKGAIDLSNNPDYPSIRRVRFKLSAGCSGFSVEYAEDSHAVPFVFPRVWYEKHNYRPEALFAVGIANGSMEPGLFDGDTVVVNTADVTLKDGKVYAMNYEGELVIKRMVRDAGQWWLASDNPDQRRYPRKVCSDDVFCVGRIVHKQSETI